MGAVGGAASQFQGCGSLPAVRQSLAKIIADAEAQLGHPLHTKRTAVSRLTSCGPVLDSRICGFECLLVDTVVEQENRLEMGVAGLGWEAIDILPCTGAALAKPLDARERLGISFGLRGGVADDSLVVLWNGDFYLFDRNVIGTESTNGNWGIRGLFFVK